MLQKMDRAAIERKAIHLARWAIISVRTLGYVPHRFDHESRVKGLFLWTWTIVALLSFLPRLFCYYSLWGFLRSLSGVSTPTELIVFAIYGVALEHWGLFQRVIGVMSVRGLARFWAKHLDLLREFDVKLGTLGKFAREFSNVRNFGKIIFLISASYATFSFLITAIFSPTSHDEDATCIAINVSSYSISTLMIFLNTVWIVFFIRIYAILARSISSEISELAINDKASKMAGIRLGDIFGLLRTLENQIETFNSQFAFVIPVELTFSAIVVITQAIFVIVGASKGSLGQVGTCLMAGGLGMFPILVVSNDAAKLDRNIKGIQKSLLDFPLELIDPDVQRRVGMLVGKLSSDPPRICPGGFLTVNRNTIISVATLLTTYILVIMQFRQGDI